jgi:large subunit ribosomal protein L5
MAEPSAAAATAPPTEAGYFPRLRRRHHDEVSPQLMREFGHSNAMQVPTLSKIAVNIGLGEALTNGRAIDTATEDLMAITGQRPVVTRARRAVSNFRLREGNPIGLALTLRGDRMWDFYDRLVNIALPRVRDFRGVSPNSFDGRGNFALGLTEQLIFPEVSFDSIDRVRGFQVNVITSAATDEEGKRLLELLGMPFSRN